MKASEIVVGEQYVVDVAPKHPITGRKVCVVRSIGSTNGGPVEVTVVYTKLVSAHRSGIGGESIEREFVAVVPPSRVLYDMAERERRLDLERQWVEFWRAFNAGEKVSPPLRAVA
jgi:hypothetical protein